MSYNGLPVLVRGGFGLLVPSDRAVICSAKPLRSYLLADYIRWYIKNFIIILLLLCIAIHPNNLNFSTSSFLLCTILIDCHQNAEFSKNKLHSTVI